MIVDWIFHFTSPKDWLIVPFYMLNDTHDRSSQAKYIQIYNSSQCVHLVRESSKYPDTPLTSMKDKDYSQLQARYMLQCWAKQENYKPIGVSATDGCWIHTTDGRKIFDLRSAHECINVGFRHPRVLQAMREQMQSVVYVTDDFASAPTAQLAHRLAHLSPGSSSKKVYFCQSGAAAVEAAIHGARMYKYNQVFGNDTYTPDAPMQYPYPYKIVSRYRSWHGATNMATSASGDPRRWFSEPLTAPGFVFAPDPGGPHSPFDAQRVDENIAYIDYMVEQEGGSGAVVGVLVEPIVGSNGIMLPPPGYLKKLRDLCDRWDLLLIVDETMTAMGRTGKLFACEHYGVIPDILIMGKALGAYCPLAAVLFSQKVARSFDMNYFGHGQSYSGHALAAAAALASIDTLIEERLLEHTRAMGEWVEDRLLEIADKHAIVSHVQGIGLFWMIHIAGGQNDQPVRRATEKYQDNLVASISRYLLYRHNIYTPADKFGIWIVPPLVVSRQEMSWVLDCVEDALVNSSRPG